MTHTGPASADFTVVVLAAGASTRLGQPKQTASVRGRPALQVVVANAVAVAGQSVVVVVGAHAAEVMPMLARTGVSTVVNRRWDEGIGASIRAGVGAVPAAADAVLLLLGDQVAVTADDLKRLTSAWKGQQGVIAAALYQGAPGVPAIFPRWCFPELLQLKGDHGAKRVLRRHATRVVHVPMSSAAIDLDTPADLAALNRAAEPPEPPDVPAPVGPLTELTLADDPPDAPHAAHHRTH